MRHVLRARAIFCVLLLAASPAIAQRDIALRLDERALRSAGIETARVEPEAAAAELVLPGTVVVPPQQTRVIAAPVAGLLEAVLVAPDETVTRGQVVAMLRSSELLEAQRALLDAVNAEALASEKLARDEALYRDRVIAERRLLVTRAEHVAARTALDERRQLLALLGMPEQDIAALLRTRRLAAVLSLAAQADGVVLGRAAVPGERIAAGAPLLTLASLTPLWVNIQVPLGRASVVETTSMVALPAQGASGFVLRVGRSADPGTQSVVAVAEIHTGAENLRPGEAVSVTLSLRSVPGEQFRVPPGAVVRHRERHWVFVRTPTGFSARPVQVLNEGASGTSLRGQLASGEQVAVRGMLFLLAELSEAEG